MHASAILNATSSKQRNFYGAQNCVAQQVVKLCQEENLAILLTCIVKYFYRYDIE